MNAEEKDMERLRQNWSAYLHGVALIMVSGVISWSVYMTTRLHDLELTVAVGKQARQSFETVVRSDIEKAEASRTVMLKKLDEMQTTLTELKVKIEQRKI